MSKYRVGEYWSAVFGGYAIQIKRWYGWSTIATKGLFLTPLHMKNGCRYYMSHYCGKITKFDKEE